MSALRSLPTLADLDATLRKVGATLEGRQVHALYLGALTSTALDIGPQKLLRNILGEAPGIASAEEANAVMPVILGYWNTLIAARQASGRAELATKKLGPKPTRTALEAFARARENELEWFARGLGAAGHPGDLGERGLRLIQSLAEGQMIFKSNAAVLAGKDEASDAELVKIRGSLLELGSMMEQTISELMNISDEMRRGALQDPNAPPAPMPARAAPRVGRNDPCPCGSGKKSKKCCAA